jgi:hypothetical protein
MSLMNQNKGKKKGQKGKNQQPTHPGAKFVKPGKGGGFAQKPHKAGGTRGS